MVLIRFDVEHWTQASIALEPHVVDAAIMHPLTKTAMILYFKSKSSIFDIERALDELQIPMEHNMYMLFDYDASNSILALPVHLANKIQAQIDQVKCELNYSEADIDNVKHRLQKAIDDQDYMKAAQLRDQLKLIQK